MVINQTIKHIRAYDNFSHDRRVVLNYTSVGKSTTEDSRSLVDSFYISCLDEGCFLNMNNFQLKDIAGDIINKIYERPYFKIEYIGKQGQREILFQTKLQNDSVKILFQNRNKSVRIIENTFDINQIKGSLFKRTLTELPNLEYIEKI